MTAVVIPRDAKKPLAVGKYARNDRPVNASFQRSLAELAGYAAYVRNRIIFRSHGTLLIPNSTGSDRVRARFAWHSGPYASALSARFVMAQQDNGTVTAPYASLKVYDSAGVLFGVALARFGAAAAATDAPDYLGERSATLVNPSNEIEIVYLDPDTDYTAVLTEHDNARVQSIAVGEIGLNPDTSNGYAPMVSVGGPILDTDRSTVATMASQLYRRGGAHLWNWYAETDASAPTIASATYTNVIDGTSTTVNGFSPGATLDLRYRDRLKDAGDVPVVMKVYASATAAAGVVRLVDLDGTLLSVPVTGAAGWYAVNGMLPNTLIKYDIHAAASSGSVTVYSVSIYQVDTAANEVLADGAAMTRIIAYDGTT